MEERAVNQLHLSQKESCYLVLIVAEVGGGGEECVRTSSDFAQTLVS